MASYLITYYHYFFITKTANGILIRNLYNLWSYLTKSKLAIHLFLSSKTSPNNILLHNLYLTYKSCNPFRTALPGQLCIQKQNA